MKMFRSIFSWKAFIGLEVFSLRFNLFLIYAVLKLIKYLYIGGVYGKRV